jgi:hypothetical protein
MNVYPRTKREKGKCLPLYCGKGDDGRGCDFREGTSDAYVNDCREPGDVWVVLCGVGP